MSLWKNNEKYIWNQPLEHPKMVSTKWENTSTFFGQNPARHKMMVYAGHVPTHFMPEISRGMYCVINNICRILSIQTPSQAKMVVFFCKSPPGKGSQAIRQAFARPWENPWFRWQIRIRCQEKDIKNTSFNMFKCHWDVNNINVSNKLRNMVMENLSRKAANLRDPSRKVMVESIPAVTRRLGVVNQLSSGKYGVWDVIGQCALYAHADTWSWNQHENPNHSPKNVTSEKSPCTFCSSKRTSTPNKKLPIALTTPDAWGRLFIYSVKRKITYLLTVLDRQACLMHKLDHNLCVEFFYQDPYVFHRERPRK